MSVFVAVMIGFVTGGVAGFVTGFVALVFHLMNNPNCKKCITFLKRYGWY